MEAEQYADQYIIHLLLGEGGQANVYLASKNNQLYALKIYLSKPSTFEVFKIQTDFLAKLNHPHLINMIDHRISANVKIGTKPEEKKPIVVLELADGGQLFEFISKTGRFTAEVCRVYMKQLLATIKYLHEVGVTHRDLKPQNILFDHEYTLKVSDFGLSRDAKGDKGDYKLKSRVGTQGYKPPELEQGSYLGLQTDLFAAGVILFIMFCGTPPFVSTKPADRIYQLIKNRNFPRFWSVHQTRKPPGFFPDSLKRLLNSFFSADVNTRPTFELLQHDDWLNGDELMKNELIDYMKAKADKIAEGDPNKGNIQNLRKYLKSLDDNKDNCEGGDRGSDDQAQLDQETLFFHNYSKLKINADSLPQFSRKRIPYSKQNPAFLVSWIKAYLRTELANKQTFMEDFASEITPTNFKLQYFPENFQVKLSLVFLIDKQDETELQLLGQLHCNEKKEVGIEWIKSQGNSFWLATVESKLNQSLQTLSTVV